MKRLILATLAVAFGVSMPLAAADKDAKAKPAAAKQAEQLIDINTAKAEELMTLDGIGQARAQAIIKGRPYRAKDELVDRKVLPQAVYEKIRARIVARQAGAKK